MAKIYTTTQSEVMPEGYEVKQIKIGEWQVIKDGVVVATTTTKKYAINMANRHAAGFDW